MKILSIDTSSKICSVSLLNDTDYIVEEHINDERTHSQKLMPLVDKVLKECKDELSSIDALACCIGPGSFTGVRIGVSTVKAFCDVTNIPIVSVNSLESLAYNTLNSKYIKKNSLVCSIIDAKNDNVYFGLFKRENNDFIQVEHLEAKNINDILDILKKYFLKDILFVGDGAVIHKYKIMEHLPRTIFVEDTLNTQSSISVGKCAYYKYSQGLYGDSNSISPLYLKKSQAERALEGEK